MSAFADVDLSFSQVRMLMVLASVDTSLPINQIAAHLSLTVASAGRNVDSLLHAGLVDRGDDDHDRRVKLVGLTAGGRDLVAGHFACHRRNLAEFTRRLSATDRRRIVEALAPVLDSDAIAAVPPTLDGGPAVPVASIRSVTR
ncbi:MAG: MarR family winged helix-turn-helix transcriptional regulator [Microlunatus sp.]|nr:MarR family winged helix-turn-helix transcriptional regulator [Microlunatus sp.]